MRITSLTIYPIKSCRGIFVSEAQVVPGGLRYDRRYMLVDAQGRMVTGRKVPELLTLETQLLSEERLLVRGEGQTPLELSLEPEGELGEELPVSVWSDAPHAALHPRGSAWFRQCLGRELRLVFLPDTQLRQVNPQRAQIGDVVSFADAYPLLVTNEASLAELNRRLGERTRESLAARPRASSDSEQSSCERADSRALSSSRAQEENSPLSPSHSSRPLGMERFRPNVVVEGGGAFDEDTWKKVHLGGLPGMVAKLCDRCVITTVDPQTGRRGREPLRTLATFRKWDGAVWFGANFVPDQAALPAQLRVGDQVVVTERRPHPTALSR